MPPGFAYSIRHCVAQSEAGPIYKLIFNKCLDSKVDVQRHAPGIAFGESRISFRKFRFLGVPGGWNQNIRYACKVRTVYPYVAGHIIMLYPICTNDMIWSIIWTPYHKGKTWSVET